MIKKNARLMTIMNQVILLIVLTRIVETLANMKCSSTTSTTIPKYHLIEKCHQSKLGIAVRANFTSLTSCKRLGIEKRALALNFSPHNANRSQPLHYSCEALKCAESEGGLSLNNDTRYDYYSIYANPLPNINSTCVPTAGMFVILPKKFNYTESQKHCKNISAVLADITDEHRTDALAQALATAGAEATYVGMRRNSNRIFLSESGGSLDCITYRAWAPGHPQRNTNMSCVILTKHHTWKTVACKDKYQVLCELIPRGPYKKGSIFSLKNLNI